MKTHSISGVLALLQLTTFAAARQSHHVELGNLDARQGLRVGELQDFGQALAIDVDGDSVHDLVMSVPLTHYAGTYAGSVYILFGARTRTYSLDPELAFPGNGLRIDGPEPGDRLGSSLGKAGDINADGVEDFALASDDRTWIVFGGPHLRGLGAIDLTTLGGTLGFELTTNVPGGNRQTFRPIGDVNADGVDDLFIGRPEREDPWSLIPMRNDLRSSANGDIDGDGDQDLLVAEGDWDSIVVLENDGSGAFPTSTQLSLQENRELELVDLDGDGDLDLIATWMKFVTSSRQEGWVAIFPGLGDGNFGPRTDLQIGVVGEGISVAVGDLDGDGDPDLAGINFQANHGTPTDPYTELRLLMNDGAGAFTLTQSQVFAYHSREIALLDVDADGDLDLCIANDRIATPTAAVVRLITNDGTGFFLPAGTLPLPGTAYIFDVGDVTGDGREDLLASNRIFPNSAAGLLPSISVPLLSSALDGDLVDIDGNGTLDFVVEDPSDGVRMYINEGGGVFERFIQSRYLAIRGRSRGSDLNGDGRADLIVVERSRVAIAFNRGGGVFGGTNSGSASVLFGTLALGASGTLDLDTLDGTNGFSVPPGPGFSSLGVAASPAGDFNTDGIDDFVFSAPFSDGDRGDLFLIYGASGLGSSGVVRPAELDATTGFKIHGEDSGGFCRSVLGGLDVNGDGRPDLVLGAPSSVVSGAAESGRVRVLFGSTTLVSAGTFDLDDLDGLKGYTLSGSPGMFLGSALVDLGDWNLDGRDDFAAGASGDDSRGQDKGTVCVLYGLPRVNGGELAMAQLDGKRGLFLHAAITRSFLGSKLSSGDWNGDGRMDLFMPSPAYSPAAADPGSVHFLWALPHRLVGDL